MNVHRLKVLESARFAGQQTQVDIDSLGRGIQPFGAQPLTSVNLLQRQAFGTDVQGNTLAGHGDLGDLILRMQAAHPHRLAEGAEHQRIAHRHLPGQRRAGDHDTRARHAERPIDPQAKTAFLAALNDLALRLDQGLTQGVDALPGHARQHNLRRIGIRAGRQQGVDLLANGL